MVVLLAVYKYYLNTSCNKYCLYYSHFYCYNYSVKEQVFFYFRLYSTKSHSVCVDVRVRVRARVCVAQRGGLQTDDFSNGLF